MSSHYAHDTNQQSTDGREGSQRLDPDLIGHWRHTDGTYSGEFSMVTDTHIVLYGDSSFVYYSRTESSFGGSYSPTEYGTWYTQDGVLYLEFDSGGYSAHEYEAYPDKVFLPNHHQRLWDRIR
jgi:hypothetical protein